jgi:NADH-quinone oxidoreductase subunit C
MIVERIKTQCPGVILEHHDFRGDQTLVIQPERFLEVVDFIYREGFQLLLDITAVDAFERNPRFDVVYHWLNLTNQERLRLKMRVNDGQPVPSLATRIKAANWFEREVFDMFGIPFSDHPNLKRLLMWEDFPGHPLRKDFPRDGGDRFCDDTGASFSGCAHSLNDGEGDRR